MKLSKVQLDELLRVQQEKEEDQEVIAKYAKEDEMKLKELIKFHMNLIMVQFITDNGRLMD
jgi:hypothetical protein